ncbi:MAG: tryptophan--tRNA ligase [Christensenellaceae bacterium]|jgi:tryptophanyl-tRNA synthetase|nr:tryptophan--tRNA ligase [Christensenellaceae bacterium]
MVVDKKILYSGIQPTGIMTIGNYIGAVSNWAKMQDEYNCIFGLADLHAITVRQDPIEYRKRATSFFAQILACGLNVEKSIVYFQSHVHQHTELQWILNCYAYVGEMQRMTQFKDKSAKHEENINMGLLDYPVLMAADILLYRADLVPVGIDQKQHIEITRDIACRFNSIYGDTFTVPDGYFPTLGAKINGLQTPTAKMGKSDADPDNAVSIIDEPDVIMRKFRKAVTDCDRKVKFDLSEKPGISNLLTIMSALTGTPICELENDFANADYKTFKEAVGSVVVESFKPVRENYARYISDKSHLQQIASLGAERASYEAEKTLTKVKRRIGLVDKARRTIVAVEK